MAPHIHISTNSKHQHHVAGVLTKLLDSLGYSHAYIGGFACMALGGTRSTQMNLLISVDDAAALRIKLASMDRHFVLYRHGFYYVQEVLPEGRDVLQHLTESVDSVKIETLPCGAIGLPSAPQPLYMVQGPYGNEIPILHPSVLIITKLKRWIQNCDSTRPQTIQQRLSDEKDLFLLIDWMHQRKVKIDCEGYQGKSKEQIRGYLREVRSVCASGKGNESLLNRLMLVTSEEDWL